jgi:hypothetical protein
MKRARRTVIGVSLYSLICTLALTSCSSATSEADCQKIIGIQSSLTEKADAYWEEDHPRNGGDGDYSRSEALIIEADRLIVDNPSCFSEKELSFAAGRLEANTQGEDPPVAQKQPATSIFDEPAQSFLLASGINSLLAVWGIPLNDGNGSRTLGAVSDDILAYLNANAGGSGDLTKNDLLTSLQPGNSLNSMVNRLFTNEEVINAVIDRWLSYLS